MSPLVRNILLYLMVFAMAPLAVHCDCNCGGGSQGTTQVGNSSSSPGTGPTVVVGKADQTNQESQVTLPLAVFGPDENSLAGASVDVSVNDTFSSHVTALENYDATNQEVVFTVEDIQEGDVISLTVRKSDGTYETFSATVSNTEDAIAVSSESGDVTDLPPIDVETDVDPSCTPPENNIAEQLVQELCSKMSSCVNFLSSGLCQEGIFLLTTLSEDLGLIGGISLQEISNQLDRCEVNLAAGIVFQDCLDDIDAISCGEVSGAYSISSPTNFSGVKDLLPSSCQNIF